MKQPTRILGVMLVSAIGVAGCGGGPTSPGNGDSGVPAKLDLTGTWTGTVTDYLGSCKPETFTVALSQGAEEINAGAKVARVIGSFSTPCEGSFPILGSLSSGRMYGSITGKGRITGDASSNGIQMTILGGSGGLENGQVVVCRIALQR